MTILRTICCLFAFVIIAGCGASAVAPAAGSFDGAGSWMRAAGRKQQYIYGASYNTVNVYTFAGELVGSLKGFQDASGICSDASGRLYVLDSSRFLIYEFPPYGLLPVNVLDDRYHTPEGCAVDPTTGNVAVANLKVEGHTAAGNVVIYPPGYYQTPTTYTAPNIVSYYYSAYDPDGNLYVDGLGPDDELELAVLPHGETEFLAVPLSGINNHRHKPAGVLWDGQYLALGDRAAKVIYRLSISGSNATIAQTVTIRGWYRNYPVNFAVSGTKLLFPLSEKLLFYNYPAGGRKKTGFLGDVGTSITITNYE